MNPHYLCLYYKLFRLGCFFGYVGRLQSDKVIYRFLSLRSLLVRPLFCIIGPLFLFVLCKTHPNPPTSYGLRVIQVKSTLTTKIEKICCDGK